MYLHKKVSNGKILIAFKNLLLFFNLNLILYLRMRCTLLCNGIKKISNFRLK